MGKIQLENLELIEVQVTTRCNISCKYCFNGDITEHSTINTKQFKKFIRKALNSENSCSHINTLRITGGEPLLEQDIVYELISFAKENGLSVELSTNGILLASCLSDLIALGLDAVKISFDSFDSDLFSDQRGNYGQQAESCIKSVISSPIMLTVRVTITENCLTGITDTIKRLLAEGVDFVEVKSVVPVGRASPAMVPPHENLYRVLEEISKNWPPEKVTILCCYLPFCEGYNVVNNKACTCCSTTAYVTADGYIGPCSYFPKLNWYNIVEHDLDNVFLSEEFSNIRNGLRTACKDCGDWRDCRNGCPAILYSHKSPTDSCFELVSSLMQSNTRQQA